jgi:hypothetical protein
MCVVQSAGVAAVPHTCHCLCVYKCMCVCECVCGGGEGRGGGDCKLPNCSTRNFVMSVEREKQTCRVLIPMSGSTFTWAEVVTDLC